MEQKKDAERIEARLEIGGEIPTEGLTEQQVAELREIDEDIIKLNPIDFERKYNIPQPTAFEHYVFSHDSKPPTAGVPQSELDALHEAALAAYEENPRN